MSPDQQNAVSQDSDRGTGTEDGGVIAEFRVPGTVLGVRSAIDRVLSLIDAAKVELDDLHGLEIALAEILNNVVEHAYADDPDGSIEILIEAKPPGLHFQIWDDGQPMPAGRLPGGAPADLNLAGHEQAEGGYGLFLIRQLARKLRYERVGARNRLSFRVALTGG